MNPSMQTCRAPRTATSLDKIKIIGLEISLHSVVQSLFDHEFLISATMVEKTRL
jgi:hypothetical protein